MSPTVRPPRPAPRIGAAIALGACLIALAAPARAEDVLIRGGTLVTLGPKGTLEGDLLVKDGRIAEVGGTIAPPLGARVIDARGRFVMPGIIDAHSHMGVYPWTMAGAGSNSDGNEATSPLTPDVRAEDSIHVEDPAWERARAGGVTSALVLPGSANLIGGEGVVVKLRKDASLEEMRFQGAPRQLKMAMGENPKRVYGGRSLFPSTRMGNLALLREAFAAASGREGYGLEFFYDLPFRPEHRNVLAQVLRSRKLPAEAAAQKIRLQVHCYTRSDILGLLRVADEFSLEIAALHHGLEAYKVAPELARRGIGLATFADWWGFKQEAWDAIPENAGICARAGVKVAIHSDSADHVQRLWHEAAKCIAKGMREEDALRSVTLWPAEILGVAARTGSLEVGKDADVAVFSHHPFDILARVDATLIDGRVVFERRPTPTSPQPASPAVFAITGARVLPVSGAPIEEGVVVVRGERIESVGPKGSPVPAGALTIDARGKTLTPGFIDVGTSVGLTEVGSDPAHQDDDEGGVAAPHARVTDAFSPASETVKVAREAGVTTVVVAPEEGPLFAGQAAVLDLLGASTRDMVVKDPYAQWGTLSSGAVARGRAKSAFSTRMGMVAELRERFAEADEYRKKLARFELERARFERAQERRAKKAAEKAQAPTATAAPEGGKDAKGDDEEPPLPPEPPSRKPRLDALVAVLERKVPLVVAAHREQDIRRALDLADELGFDLVLNHATEAYRVADLLATKKVPVLLGPVTTQPSSLETWGAIYENAALLHAAGVRFAIQTSSAHNARQVATMAGLAASYGLPRDAALRAITLGAAEILGIAKERGSIEAGKVANLVLLDGDPLEPRSRVLSVWIRGREVPATSHQRALLERWGGK